MEDLIIGIEKLVKEKLLKKGSSTQELAKGLNVPVRLINNIEKCKPIPLI